MAEQVAATQRRDIAGAKASGCRCYLDRECERNKLPARRRRKPPCSAREEFAMKPGTAGTLAIFAGFALVGSSFAQDLGPQVRKLADGVYVVAGVNYNSNAGIVLTQDGVVVIDTGQNAIEARKILDIVKKLTPMPVRFVIDTEPHPDHTTGHFVFSPPAVVVAAAGAGESMRATERNAPDRIQRLAATSPEFRAALANYKFIAPHIEYYDRMTVNLGGRTLELIHLKGVHS